MPRSVYEKPSLQKQKDAAHQIGAQDHQRIVNYLFPRDARTKVVDSLANQIWNEQAETHRHQYRTDTRGNVPSIRSKIACKFPYLFHSA